MSLPDYKRSMIRVATVPVAVGDNIKVYFFGTASALATVLTAGFFNFARDFLAVGDFIHVLSGRGGTPESTIVKVLTVPSSGDVTVQSDSGEPQSNRAVVATVGGLTTGLITASDTAVDITSANADYIVTLPAIASVPFNHVIRGYIAATGCEIRTPDASGTKINNVDADGTQEMALPANSIFVATKHAADNWIVEVYVAAGTRTIPTPD